MMECKGFDFYTNQAIIYHALYYMNLIPSTYSIALFVFLAGTVLQLYHDGKSTDGTEGQKARLFLYHAIPLFFIQDKTIHVKPFIISLIIYILYIGSFQKIKYIYSNMYTYLYTT